MPKSLSFRLAEGFNFRRRSIGFLETEQEDDELNAGSVFDGLTGTVRQLVRSRMDYWLNGGSHPKYFHGWPNEPRYKQCFVFKWDEGRIGQRFYGFLCNPNPNWDPGFRTCVLILHATKHENETDLTYLDRVNRWRQDLRTEGAIKRIYPEYGGAHRWKH
jgi:hypothetical protein